MRRKVLHLIPSFHQGGSERQAIQLVKLLSADGSYDVSVACLDGGGVLIDELKASGFDSIPEFPLTSFYDSNMARQLFRFREYLRSNKIDLVQTHDFYSNIFGMFGAKFAGVPVRIAAKRETGMRSSGQLFIERRAFSLSSAIVVNAEGVGRYLSESGVDRSKIKIIYNGLDTSRFETHVDAMSSYQRWDLPADFRYISIVANLRSPVKDHDMFLRSAARISKEMPNVGFIIAGEGELLENTKETADKLGIGDRTHFIGRCDDVPSLLAITDVGVLSSRSEGFSNSVIEYMAAGKPVVATNVGGISEAVLEGITGYLVESGDDAAMADRVLTLLKDEKLGNEFGEAGRRRVSENFSADAQLAKTLDLYSALLKS